MSIPLRFGVPTLDELINPFQASASHTGRWTAAIVGPDGCGKSILSLHLASNYWLLNCKDRAWERESTICPRIIYVSTDLSHEQALVQWQNFGLDYPANRSEALKAAYEMRDRTPIDPNEHRLPLEPVNPVEADDPTNDTLMQLIADPPPCVYFVDLQSRTAGDDWGFVNQLVGLLPKRVDPPHHLLIVDAVEGLETFVGQHDAFGMQRDRRSRVAQLVRRAHECGAHVVFVVEQPRLDERQPEQFVTDLVIRLRQQMDSTYSQRTVEIEKCRAVAHARGQHEIAIRTGKGSYTGNEDHLDDPRIRWALRELDKDPAAITLVDPQLLKQSCMRDYLSEIEAGNVPGLQVVSLAHVRVITSIHRWNREVREEIASIPELAGSPSFGLPDLDEWLKKPTSEVNNPCSGSLTLLLGDAGTRKGRLARGFLAEAFVDASSGWKKLQPNGAAVLISTRFLDGDALRTRVAKRMKSLGTQEEIKSVVFPRVWCQRLNVRHLSAGAFLDVVTQYVRRAQDVIWKGLTPDVQDEIIGRHGKFDQRVEARREVSHAVRFVIEDWSEILRMHPSLADDPLFLQSILLLLKREGLSSLIVSTQPGQPWAAATRTPQDLRSLDELQLFTWTVPFFGDRRVALTPLAGKACVDARPIYELRPDDTDPECLVLDPHFDLYADVDKGAPRRVPLVIQLYGGSHMPSQAEPPGSPHFLQVISDSLSQVFPGRNEGEVVTLKASDAYDAHFYFFDTLDDTNLDYTLVMQIDEFWGSERKALLDLTRHWTSPPLHHGKQSELPADVRPHPLKGQPQLAETPWVPEINYGHPEEGNVYGARPQEAKSITVSDFFVSAEVGAPQKDGPVDRIPYLWDFGLLLADRHAWERHKHLVVRKSQGRRQVERVGNIWNSLLVKDEPSLALHDDQNSKLFDATEKVSWDLFLTACQMIGEQEGTVALDVDLSTCESLSCLILELWASEQVALDPTVPNPFDLATMAGASSQPTGALHELLAVFPYSLLIAFQRLVRACSHLRSHRRQVYRDRPAQRCVASREWYHTASAKLKEAPDSPQCVLRLPGSFTTRGDWSLAVAEGSRSQLLARNALNLLSTRLLNLLRLQDGVGLPVRDILPPAEIGNLPTSLTYRQENTGRLIQLSYAQVCSVGACKQDNFNWLWRSRITNYHNSAIYWRRWIARMIEEQHKWNQGDFSKLETASEKSVRLAARDHATRVIAELKQESLTLSSGWLQVPTTLPPEHLEGFEQFTHNLEIIYAATRI